MDGVTLQQRLDTLGYNQVTFGKAIGKDVSTVRRWIVGELPVPRYAVLALEVLEARAASSYRWRRWQAQKGC